MAHDGRKGISQRALTSHVMPCLCFSLSTCFSGVFPSKTCELLCRRHGGAGLSEPSSKWPLLTYPSHTNIPSVRISEEKPFNGFSLLNGLVPPESSTHHLSNQLGRGQPETNRLTWRIPSQGFEWQAGPLERHSPNGRPQVQMHWNRQSLFLPAF